MLTRVFIALALLAFSFVHVRGASMPARTANGMRLPRGTRSWRDNHESRDNAEADLRNDEPEPVDALVEQRIDDAQHAVDQTGPQNRARSARRAESACAEHRQHRA